MSSLTKTALRLFNVSMSTCLVPPSSCLARLPPVYPPSSCLALLSTCCRYVRFEAGGWATSPREYENRQTSSCVYPVNINLSTASYDTEEVHGSLSSTPPA